MHSTTNCDSLIGAYRYNQELKNVEKRLLLKGWHPGILIPRKNEVSAFFTAAAAQGVRPLARSGSQPYVPTVQGGVANRGRMVAEMPEPFFGAAFELGRHE